MFSDRHLNIIKYAAGVLALWFLIVVPAWYLGHYLLEPRNPYRGEYLQGAAISLVLLAPTPVLVFFIARYLNQKGKK